MWPDVPPNVAGKLMGVLTFRACVHVKAFIVVEMPCVWVLGVKGPPAARVSAVVATVSCREGEHFVNHVAQLSELS